MFYFSVCLLVSVLRTYSLRGSSSSRHLSTENSKKSSEHSGHTSDPYAYPGQSIENCVVEVDPVNGNKHCKQFGVVASKMVIEENTENYVRHLFTSCCVSKFNKITTY